MAINTLVLLIIINDYIPHLIKTISKILDEISALLDSISLLIIKFKNLKKQIKK